MKKIMSKIHDVIGSIFILSVIGLSATIFVGAFVGVLSNFPIIFPFAVISGISFLIYYYLGKVSE